MLFVIVLCLLVFLVVLNSLRLLLSMPLPAAVALADHPAKRIDPLLEPLFEARHAELSALGFALASHAELEVQPAHIIHAGLARLYRSADGLTLAVVFVTLDLEDADCARVHFLSRNGQGRMFATVPWNAFNAAFSDLPAVLGQTGAYATLAEQYDAHRTFVADKAVQPWPADGECVAVVNAYERTLAEDMAGRGLTVMHEDGARRLSLKGGLAVLGKFFSGGRRAHVADAAGVPLPRLVLLWAVWNQRRAHFAPRLAVQWGLFVFSALAFVGLGTWFFGWQTAVLLLLVLALHEGGHWLAMRLLGYRNVQVLLLPLAGGVTMGEEEQASAHDRAWVALAGPLPGLLLGVALLFGGAEGMWLHLALLLVLVNVFNLLPVLPLDGGQVLQSLLPQQAVLVSLLFCGLSVIGLGLLAWWLHAFELLLVALLPLASLPGLRRQHAQWRQWRTLPAPASAMDEQIQALSIVQTGSKAPLKTNAQVMQAEALLKRVHLRPMGGYARLAVLAVWLAAFALLLLPGVYELSVLVLIMVLVG